MDHQKPTILLIFGTLSLGGCGGHPMRPKLNLNDKSQMSTPNEYTNNFRSNLTCLFLSVRAKLKKKKHSALRHCMCNYILGFKLNFVDFIAGKPYWRFHSTLKTRLYYLMPQWNFLYLAIIQWHGKKLSYIQVNLCQKLFFSLWPVWDIFVQNQYAGENGLNGLLCYQNHH